MAGTGAAVYGGGETKSLPFSPNRLQPPRALRRRQKGLMLMEQVGGGQKAGGDGTCRRWRQKGPRRQRDKGPRSVLISSAFITNPQHCLHRRPISATSDECCSVQLIDGDGSFNDTGIESFIKEVKLHECGLSYAVVSIMGPQSSGKSTLLNNLFYTNFREMDAFKGRSQTTKGIWMAKCAGIEPCTIVMDLEGTDGRECCILSLTCFVKKIETTFRKILLPCPDPKGQ